MEFNIPHFFHRIRTFLITIMNIKYHKSLNRFPGITSEINIIEIYIP